MDEENKRTERIVHPLGGAKQTLVINESGLYSLILSSKLPQAKEFKHWVTAEVLPQIRQTGGYCVQQIIRHLPNENLALFILGNNNQHSRKLCDQKNNP